MFDEIENKDFFSNRLVLWAGKNTNVVGALREENFTCL